MDDVTPPPVTEPRKPWFETVVTSTPVLLTVIATFMVGRSSTEMTMAQYHRSVASQNQSKVGDQWGFYQAKRIRGQILEGTADLLLAQGRTPFGARTLPDAAHEMVNHLRAARSALVNGKLPPGAEDKTKEGLALIGKDLDALIAAAEKGAAHTEASLNSAAQDKAEVLSAESLQHALEALYAKAANHDGEAQQHSKEAEALDPEQAALIAQIIGEIKTRKPESEIAAIALKLKEESLRSAIHNADRRADVIYRSGKRIEKVLEKLDALVDRQSSVGLDFQRIAHRLRVALPAGGADLAAWERSAEAVRTLNARMQADYKAARHAYSARRYEDDARSNQELAYLYEVKVVLNSARSDKHLLRSKMFLFAMLVAQAGVTVATLAIAVKRKSVFWALATLTGLVAIGFGLYVYLDLWPMPGF